MELPRPSIGIYLTAGWPSIGAVRTLVEEAPTDFLEVGLPTHNPKYDGPFIRRTHREAEGPRGLEALRHIPKRGRLVVMAYAEDYVRSLEEAVSAVSSMGALSLLLPDLLVDYPDILGEYVKLCDRYGMRPSFFLPGKFPHGLLQRIAEYDPIFVYVGLYASTGISLPIYVERNLRLARELAPNTFIVAGFAVDSSEKAVRLVESGADGVVIGTAFLRRLAKGTGEALAFIKDVVLGFREKLKNSGTAGVSMSRSGW